MDERTLRVVEMCGYLVANYRKLQRLDSYPIDDHVNRLINTLVEDGHDRYEVELAINEVANRYF